jgi:hypothetical protein
MGNRPVGVTVLAILSFVAGLIYLWNGLDLLGYLIFGPSHPAATGSLFWSGVFAIILGVIWLAVGGALWSLQPWAWMFAFIMAIFGLLESTFTLIAGGGATYFGMFLFPLIILIYLNSASTKKAFGMPE